MIFIITDDPIPEPENEDEEWVEYVDALGRSKMCMKSDLEKFRKQDLEEFGEAGNERTEVQQSLLSEDMRREQLRQKWEKEEEANLRKPLLHFDDVTFDEARGMHTYFINK